MFVQCSKSKLLSKWQVFLSAQSHVTANYWENTGSIHPSCRKLCYKDRKKTTSSERKAIERHPPSFPSLRNKSLFLFIFSKDSQEFITPRQQTTKIIRKLPPSYLPPCLGLQPAAWLPRRWSMHAANWSAELRSSRKTWGCLMVLITKKKKKIELL